MTQATKTTVLTTTSYDAAGYFEIILNPILQTSYSYIGFVLKNCYIIIGINYTNNRRIRTIW